MIGFGNFVSEIDSVSWESCLFSGSSAKSGLCSSRTASDGSLIALPICQLIIKFYEMRRLRFTLTGIRDPLRRCLSHSKSESQGILALNGRRSFLGVEIGFFMAHDHALFGLNARCRRNEPPISSFSSRKLQNRSQFEIRV